MALPGLRRIDHVGFTVPDLEEAHRFLVDVLGCEYLYSLGPFSHPDAGDDWMTRHLAVHPDTVMVENRWFRLAGETLLEVFHYSAPDQRTQPPRNSDVGGHHVAFYVDDLDAAVDHLRTAGVEVLDGPTASRGPAEGNRWIYFRSPWGMQFELVSAPDGKLWDRENPRP
ncbi:glyoxalase [Nocardioides sp. Soil777]|uniref:VOC family protein n=1 Tax=Nocardioides sp. Soil777 TaxID=1736409 RepID=UPI0007035665|nr:VOC family protein [Nocardioides sp. Soil777]KRF05884.1 glyoxalase [Nocardioides sp. Soil777]